MRVLYVGGSGEISTACVEAAVARGHEVTVFNRGQRSMQLPEGVEHVLGDFADDAAYSAVARRGFDVVCQFLIFDPAAVRRDVELFSGHCGHYLFVSTASAYQKPCLTTRITEDTPLENPFWAYSRRKIACEVVLREAADAMPATIVRPSHTYRARLPSTVVDGDHLAWRLLNDKPVIVHGDGESLWTLTHAEDFARAFVQLAGLPAAIGESVHITRDDGHTWNNILRAVGACVGRAPDIVPVLSNTLVAEEPAWEGPLLGDKSNTLLFDTSRIEALTGGWKCEVSLEEGVARAWAHARKRLADDYRPDPRLDALVDGIIEAQCGRLR